MMVTLMLLRRMPEFQGFVREHKWVRIASDAIDLRQ